MNPVPRKILVAQTIYLGDLVLALPMLTALRRAFPDAAIDVLIQAGLENVVQNHPAVARIHVYDKRGTHGGLRGMVLIARMLRKQNYDVALVLPGSIRTALAVWLARIPVRIGGNDGTGLLLFEDMVKFPGELKKSPGAWPMMYIEKLIRRLFPGRSIVTPFFTHVAPIDRRRSAARRHLQLLEPLGIEQQSEGDPVDFGLLPTPRLVAEVDDILKNHGRTSIVALAPGSAWSTKRWPTEAFARVACRLVEEGRTVIVIGGEEDRPLGVAIAAYAGPDAVVNLCGALSPPGVVELLRRSQVLVTNDSAPAHLAQAAGTPCITILGPTDRAFGFAHEMGRNEIIENNAISCRPCTPHGGNRCPLGTHICMTSIEPEHVLQRALSFGQ